MIKVDALSKRFGAVQAVQELSFEARAGQVTALLGPNGAGKSTTLRILIGLSQADSGAATFDGVPYQDLPHPIRTIGALVEDSTFHPGRTAHAHLRALAMASALPAHRPAEVLRLVDLEDAAGRRVGGFSSGMRQRLGLAAALLGNPATLILDEPQNGLDPLGTRWLRSFLRGLADEGRTVLISSHQLAEMAQIADDIVVVNRGRLVRAAPLDRLLAERGAATADGRQLEEIFVDLVDTGPGAGRHRD